jgi:hypothetical protein
MGNRRCRRQKVGKGRRMRREEQRGGRAVFIVVGMQRGGLYGAFPNSGAAKPAGSNTATEIT